MGNSDVTIYMYYCSMSAKLEKCHSWSYSREENTPVSAYRAAVRNSIELYVIDLTNYPWVLLFGIIRS